jgi:hypothetical protein
MPLVCAVLCTPQLRCIPTFGRKNKKADLPDGVSAYLKPASLRASEWRLGGTLGWWKQPLFPFKNRGTGADRRQ